MMKEEDYKANLIDEEALKQRIFKQNLIFDRQQREIEVEKSPNTVMILSSIFVIISC